MKSPWLHELIYGVVELESCCIAMHKYVPIGGSREGGIEF